MPDDMLKGKCDLLKLRAEENQRNFLSLRLVEWGVAFQSYAGYGIIAGAYAALKPCEGATCVLGSIMLGAAAVLYFASLYLSVRLQERMKFYRDAMNSYVDALHKKLKVQKLEADVTDGPIHHGWYAFRPLQLIHLTAFGGVVCYAAVSSQCLLPWALGALTGLLAILLHIIAARWHELGPVSQFLSWYRTHSGTFKKIPHNDIWAN